MKTRLRSRTPSRSANSTEIMQFVGSAFHDYLASRCLLNLSMPTQAAMLASTAVEKYFKAILACTGNRSHGHLKKAHLNAVKNYDPTMYASLNKEFLDLLTKTFDLRYPDSLPTGFTLVIASREFLAELDHTAMAVQRAFRFEKKSETVKTQYDLLMDTADQRLVTENHVYLQLEKAAFVAAKNQYVYEIRVSKKDVVMETYYHTLAATSDGHFLREGFTPKDSGGKQFQLAFKPIEKEPNQKIQRNTTWMWH